VPQEYGIKAIGFIESGSVFNYGGPTTSPGSTQSLQFANSNIVRSSVGVGLVWASPFGAPSINYAVPLTKASYDLAQPFSFDAVGL
jgi:outer membrane protein insertion porin family